MHLTTISASPTSSGHMLGGNQTVYSPCRSDQTRKMHGVAIVVKRQRRKHETLVMLPLAQLSFERKIPEVLDRPLPA